MKTGSLRKSLITGSAWTLASVAAAQGIRLGKSLVLSRLLFPEAYGVMSIVWSVLYILDMLSDVGLSSAIVRSARGDETGFLNTAWTMKVIRGSVLCTIAIALAYPISLFYNKPELAFLIPIAGLTTFIEGFVSTNIYSCQRRMAYARITILDLTSEIVGTCATIVWAVLSPSVLALLGGAVLVQISRLICSHLALPGIRNKFFWDGSAFRELTNYGKWVLFSSAIYLAYSQGDRILLGKFLTASLLGVYSIAVMLSEAVFGVINRLNDSVLFSALSKIAINEPHRLSQVLYKARLGTDAIMILPIGVLMVIGNHLVNFLYDPRYAAAGWMLQILCVRLMMVSMLVGGTSCLFALGHSRYSLIQNVCRAVWIFCMVPLGWTNYGMVGVLWAVALSEVPVFFVIWSGLYKYKIFSLRHELRSLLFVGAGLLLGFAVLKIGVYLDIDPSILKWHR